MKDSYKLIIIGGGAGGFAAAIKANELNVDTLIINSGLPLGGTCVNVGCVPSKYMIENAEYIFESKNPRFNSIKIKNVQFDFEDIVHSQLNIVDNMRNEKYEQVLRKLPHVDFIKGKASFISENEVDISGKKIKGEKFVIATGSKAKLIDVKGVESIDYMTHIEALHLKKLPSKLTIIGGGAVGVEFAQMFSHFGSKVTLITRGDRLIKGTEPEISEYLEKYLKEDGIDIIKNGKVSRFEKNKDETGRAFVENPDGESEIVFDKVLFAIGKNPNIESLNLDKVNVDISENHSIKVNKYLQTSNPSIYAVGDVIDVQKRMETTAGREGSLAVLNIIQGNHSFINYDEVPYAIFATPSVAGVGLRDEDVFQTNLNCSCLSLTLDKVPKALLIGDTRGYIKMVIDHDTKEILGMHLISKDAVDIIHEAVMIVKNKMTVSEVADTIHIFPTLSELIKLVAQSSIRDLSSVSCCI